MPKPTSPLDSPEHKIVLVLAILFLIIGIGMALTPAPVTTEAVSFGAGLGETMQKMFLTLASIITACVGLAISAKSMRDTRSKKNTGIHKQTAWYLLFYFVVLTLPLLLLVIGA